VRLASTDWLVLEEVFVRGEYSFIPARVRTPRLIVDLGANVGFSLRYWHQQYPTARMIALEPDAGNFAACARNVAEDGFTDQVVLLQIAVGARRRSLSLIREGGEWAYRVKDTVIEGAPAVEVHPLGEILRQHAFGQRIDLLKCDIEGGERELFSDCSAWIDAVDVIVVELHPPYGVHDLATDLKKARVRFEMSLPYEKADFPIVLLQRRGDQGLPARI
jgi:FkbM family methyltransferase